MEREAARTLGRLLPRIETTFAREQAADPVGWSVFVVRLEQHFNALFGPLAHVYGTRYDFYFQLERFLQVAASSWFARPGDLRALDVERESTPDWFTSHTMMGGVCYVDLFAGNIDGIHARIPYFEELGLTYLHLMPLFRTPEGHNDGGYAVSSYREVHPKLGTMADLSGLGNALRERGISLVLDFVFNHTSDEHEWAVEARAFPDDEDHNCYLMFPDRTLPDAYDATVREIFPDQRPGSFTWTADAGEHGRWVWTTFHSFQWDLNYANPLTFERMAGEMLFLANQGVEILRLDAVAFIWKRLGTVCESLPEAHLLVRAFNAMARIAAPALIFKSEAIVHPEEVASFIHPGECQISYNPLQMALGWETLATRDARLLRTSLAHWFAVPEGCAWVNYVRSHDDIGWTFDDGDAMTLGINGFDHRRFLNDFYVGRFPGSFARGLPFQEDPRTGDCRISGATASLAGLEKAIAEEGPEEMDMAIRRVLVLYAIALSASGIPLLYLGDELAALNDYAFASDPEQSEDSRWVHRITSDPERFARRSNPSTIEGRMFSGLWRLIQARLANPVFGAGSTEFIDIGNDHVIAFSRRGEAGQLLAFMNVTEAAQTVRSESVFPGVEGMWRDVAADRTVEIGARFTLQPYQVMWLRMPQ